jgi:hypothetical protein
VRKNPTIHQTENSVGRTRGTSIGAFL